MKFILEEFKLSIVVLSGVIILYITEWVRYGCVENFVDFQKKFLQRVPGFFYVLVLSLYDYLIYKRNMH